MEQTYQLVCVTDISQRRKTPRMRWSTCNPVLVDAFPFLASGDTGPEVSELVTLCNLADKASRTRAKYGGCQVAG